MQNKPSQNKPSQNKSLSNKPLRYKPLQGHHLVSFILLRDFSQIALTVEEMIPADCWSRIQLWHSNISSKDNKEPRNQSQNADTKSSQYWIQIQPPIRLNCQKIKGQPFIAKGAHLQAGEVIEPIDSSVGLTTEEPCLIWLEFGELKVRKQNTLIPIGCHKLLTPLQPTVLPLWQPNTIVEAPSTVKEKTYPSRNTHSMLALEQLKTEDASNFLRAMVGKENATRTKAKDKNRTGWKKRSLWQQITAALKGKKSRPPKKTAGKNTANHAKNQKRNQPSYRRKPFWPWIFSAFGYRGNSTGKAGENGSKAASKHEIHSQAGSQRGIKQPNLFLQKLNEYWREKVMRSQLGSLIGKRQAKYLHRMKQQFESGDLSEALKMAVPLSDYRKALDQTLEQKSLPSFGIPGKRQNLSIGLYRSSNRRSYGLADESYTQMRSLYEKAYQQLKKGEQHKEAAFVLAELLNRIDETVDYLAEKGFLAEAAEISEHRSERIEKAIKLWIQAGEVERAIALAIRSNKFKSALLLLKGNKQALPLETAWLQRLIDSGDFEALFSYYADNSYPNTTDALRAQRLTVFFQTILPKDYLQEPTWLARYICTQPWDTVKTELSTLLQTPWDSDFAQFWNTFYPLINQHKDWKTALKSRTSQPLLKEWYRQTAMYYGHPSITISNQQLNFLSAQITDRLFLHCKPKTFSNPFIELPAEASAKTATFQFYPSEALITDIAVTAKGRACLAMGALGVRIYNPKGQCLKQLSTPAHKLVSPASGSTVIAVEHREKLHTTHRIQLHTQTVSFMGQQPISAYSRQHNGATWPVGIGNRISLIDVMAEEWTKIWNTNHLEGSVRQIVSNNNQLTFLIENAGQVNPWQYRLPQLRLTSRANIDTIEAPKHISKLSLGADGEIVGMSPVIDANKQITNIEFYRSANLKTYKRMGQIDQDTQFTQPLTEETITVIYSNASTLIVVIEQSSQKQLIQAYSINATKLALLFTIESPVQPTVVQVNSSWIAIGQGDQFLVYQTSSEQSYLMKIS